MVTTSRYTVYVGDRFHHTLSVAFPFVQSLVTLQPGKETDNRLCSVVFCSAGKLSQAKCTMQRGGYLVCILFECCLLLCTPSREDVTTALSASPARCTTERTDQIQICTNKCTVCGFLGSQWMDSRCGWRFVQQALVHGVTHAIDRNTTPKRFMYFQKHFTLSVSFVFHPVWHALNMQKAFIEAPFNETATAHCANPFETV